MPRIAHLPERSTVAVTGADAEKLLQGLSRAIWSGCAVAGDPRGLLSPQGKILFEFMVVAIEGGFMLETSRARAADLVKRLGSTSCARRSDRRPKCGGGRVRHLG